MNKKLTNEDLNNICKIMAECMERINNVMAIFTEKDIFDKTLPLSEAGLYIAYFMSTLILNEEEASHIKSLLSSRDLVISKIKEKFND